MAALRLQLPTCELARWAAFGSREAFPCTVVGEIRCPTLVTAAESDMASSNAKELYDALKCPKAMIRFSDSDGAGMHCEALNRSMANRQIFNWLDETMASRQ